MSRMSLRDRLMIVFRGGKADRVPFTIYKWILDQATDGGKKETFRDRGLTPINAAKVFSEKHDGLTIDVKNIGSGRSQKVITTITTPVGQVIEEAGFDPTLGSRWVKKHFIETPDDYKVMKYYYDHAAVEPSYDEWVQLDKEMGREGIVLGQIMPIPIQWLCVEIMGADAWSRGVMLHAEEFQPLFESLTKMYKRLIQIAADSPAEVIWLDDNVTGTMMSPKIFNRYCKPIYDWSCKILKEAGKLSFAHYDGTNSPLKDCIASVDIDIIEAFTPPPMEQMTVAQARQAWPDKVLSVNIPGNIMAEPAEVIEEYITGYMAGAGDGAKFAIGCTEEFQMEKFEHAFGAVAAAMEKFQSII